MKNSDRSNASDLSDGSERLPPFAGSPASTDPQRKAVAGFLLLGVLSWVLPAATSWVRGNRPRPAAVIYGMEVSVQLAWSPSAVFGSPERFAGRLVSPDGTPGPLVGGWRGLLLGNPLDVNTATAEDFEALPGIGPKMAAALVDARSKLGYFRRVDDLRDAFGVGPKVLERLRPLLRIDPDSAPE